MLVTWFVLILQHFTFRYFLFCVQTQIFSTSILITNHFYFPSPYPTFNFHFLCISKNHRLNHEIATKLRKTHEQKMTLKASHNKIFIKKRVRPRRGFECQTRNRRSKLNQIRCLKNIALYKKLVRKHFRYLTTLFNSARKIMLMNVFFYHCVKNKRLRIVLATNIARAVASLY